MSEQLKNRGEHKEAQSKELHDQQEALRKNIEKKAEQSSHEHAKNIEKIRTAVEVEAETKQEHAATKQKESSKETDQQPIYVNKELKDLAYQRTLRRARNKLSPPARMMSRVIHQPAVEAVSEVAGKTIARPSGILMGGIMAFFGSSAFLWAAKHYGFRYNFLLFALFFAGGFFVGLLIELGIYLAKRKN